MKKVIYTVISIVVFLSMFSCKENESSKNQSNEQINNWTEVKMSNGAIIYDSGRYANVLDYETMEATLLCNIPNCSHTTSQCLASTLKDTNQLPVIYNNCAYYFTNYNEFTDGKDGKTILDLRTTIMKYDFNKMEFNKILQFEGYNANCNGGGSYLTGSEYYFTTNNGNPEYDDAGNVNGSSNNGQGKLYCLNLDTEELTDYGEIFNYEEYKKMYPEASIDTVFKGRNGNTLYFMISICTTTYCIDKAYAFDIETHKFEKIADKRLLCAGDGYVVYMTEDGEYGKINFYEENKYELVIEDIKTGKIIEGPEFIYYNLVTVCNKKVWYDGKCYDIASGKEVVVNDLLGASAIGMYENNYIIRGYDENGQEIFEKVPCEEIDKLFE